MNITSVVILLMSTFMSIILHEVAHGYAAYKLGDDTAKRMGRISLNPLNHIDLFGTIALPLILLWSGSGFLFGWRVPKTPDHASNDRAGGINSPW